MISNKFLEDRIINIVDKPINYIGKIQISPTNHLWKSVNVSSRLRNGFEK